jgi:glycosyltransferase involved in cell wall biosynthesis
VDSAGMIVNERDDDAWVKAISELIEDPVRRSELSRMGIARARSRFAWPVVARSHLDFFSSFRN